MPSTESGLTKEDSELKMFNLKNKAINYYQNNGVPQKMEDVLNQMFFENPGDVYGYLSKYFEKFCKDPSIVKLIGKKVLDSRGGIALGIDVYCHYKNEEKLFASIVFPNSYSVYEHASQDEKDEEQEERKLSLQAAIEIISSSLSEQLIKEEVDVTKQRYIDTLLIDDLEKRIKEEEERRLLAEEEGDNEGDASKKDSTSKLSKSAKSPGNKAAGKKGAKEIIIIPDAPKETLFRGCQAVGAVSLAMCLTGAKARDVELYDHILLMDSLDLEVNQLNDQEMVRPTPLITILCSGKAAPGKLNCIQEFMIVPLPFVPSDQVVLDSSAIYKFVAKSVAVKGPSTLLVNHLGAIVTQMDKPEQGFDLIMNALTTLGLQDHYRIVLNLAGQEIFDYEKGKYEVMGGIFKSAEELTDFYADMINRYPSIVGLIDPMRPVETEAWIKLAERLSEKCLIFANKALKRPGIFLNELPNPLFQFSAGCLKFQDRTTVSEVIDAAQKMRDSKAQLVLSCSNGDVSDTWIVDIAFGLRANFLRIGAPNRGERISKLLRWQTICEVLTKTSRLKQSTQEDFDFVVLRAPTPVEEGEENEGEIENQPDNAEEKNE